MMRSSRSIHSYSYRMTTADDDKEFENLAAYESDEENDAEDAKKDTKLATGESK